MKSLAHLFIGNKTTATTVCTNESHQPQVSSRPKRKLISSPASSLPEDKNGEQPERQRQNIKRVRKAVGRDKPSAVDAAPPSKGMYPNLLVDYTK